MDNVHQKNLFRHCDGLKKICECSKCVSFLLHRMGELELLKHLLWYDTFFPYILTEILSQRLKVKDS